MLAALPLIVLAIVLVALGGAVFALGLLVLGVICLRELFSMFPRARPVVLGGFLALAGLTAAAGWATRTPCCSRSSPRSR